MEYIPTKPPERKDGVCVLAIATLGHNTLDDDAVAYRKQKKSVKSLASRDGTVTT